MKGVGYRQESSSVSVKYGGGKGEGPRLATTWFTKVKSSIIATTKGGGYPMVPRAVAV